MVKGVDSFPGTWAASQLGHLPAIGPRGVLTFPASWDLSGGLGIWCVLSKTPSESWLPLLRLFLLLTQGSWSIVCRGLTP